MSDSVAPTERTRVVREPQRAVYDRSTIYTILDEAFFCHVGFSTDGQTYVIPTMFARVGDGIYFHGSAASRMLRNLSNGLSVCITVTLADGLVLARSVLERDAGDRQEVRDVGDLGAFSLLLGVELARMWGTRAFMK